MKCVISGCTNQLNHKLPRNNPIILEKWLSAINKTAEEVENKTIGVCFIHFKQEDFTHQEIDAPFVKNRRLRKTAVPSLFLSAAAEPNTNHVDNKINKIDEHIEIFGKRYSISKEELFALLDEYTKNKCEVAQNAATHKSSCQRNLQDLYAEAEIIKEEIKVESME